MVQHAAGQSNIPLHCNICPKKPNFSDTSHLLTHVASKQHLSNYFKLRVRVVTDPAAQRHIDEYDAWYLKWNLEDLMRDRMSQKEKRTKGGNRAGSRRASAAPPQLPSSRSGSVPASMPVPRREASLRNNLLDPQLVKIKTEPNSRPITPGLTPSFDAFDVHRSYTAPMHTWGSMPYIASPSQAGTPNSYASDADDDDDDASSYSYAPTRVPRRRKMSDENTSWHGSASASVNGSVHQGDDQDALDTPNDMARLKGDIWPGMDIFDSATPEMRRKRNQKKATSVIVQLQATSQTVTPTELIFDNLGQFKKERVISGEPNSCGSPLRGETTPEPDEPPVKKRATKRRPRVALTEKDPNGGRSLRNRRTGSHHPGFAKTGSQYVDGSDDIDDDDVLTYGQQHPPQRRSGLSIHRDNSGPDITFDRPSGMQYLTAGFPDPMPITQSDNRNMRAALGRTNGQLRYDGYHPQDLQQSYRNQPRPAAAGFRPSEPHMPPARDFSAFGAFTSQSMFPGNHLPDFTTQQVGSNGFYAPKSHLAPEVQGPASLQPFIHDSGMQMQDWDVFGDVGLGALETIGFNTAPNDTVGANPLFFESESGLPEDDDATLSAPLSDTSPA